MENYWSPRSDHDSTRAAVHPGLEPTFRPAHVHQPGLGLRARAVAGRGSRVLLVCALGTDPREITATCRLLGIARTAFETAHVQTEVLNLSLANVERTDWRGMSLDTRNPARAGAPRPQGMAAHGVLILTPPHWRRASSALKLLVNRSASAIAGDAASKEPVWSHQPYTGARTYGLVTHGDLRSTSQARHALCEWLDWMSLLEACDQVQLHHIPDDGESPDGTRHDEEMPLEWEVRCATAALLRALAEIEAGRLYAPEHLLMRAWPR